MGKNVRTFSTIRKAILQQYMNIQIQIILMEIAHSIYMKGVIQLHVHVKNTTQI